MFCHLTVALWKAQSKVEEWSDVKVMAATWKNTANQFEAELGAYKCICEELNAAK
ncbi:hypothetical protein UFOVP75_82 [uncultured Caudovirales phage]|uniref:Uncharacterized protein n=1 Tax=uncultured Caudovirales phage TaxID=2100421 RepID=A0A6J5L0S9_9CAUD|nr:hypothetical protein UFOVP75_82 [uncultured Caudovirales phage]